MESDIPFQHHSSNKPSAKGSLACVDEAQRHRRQSHGLRDPLPQDDSSPCAQSVPSRVGPLACPEEHEKAHDPQGHERTERNGEGPKAAEGFPHRPKRRLAGSRGHGRHRVHVSSDDERARLTVFSEYLGAGVPPSTSHWRPSLVVVCG